jgi:enoyl-CoA hydratase/carnithine racemase
MTNRELRAHFEHAMSVFNRFERLPIPTIAAVQGTASAAGSSSLSGPI